MTEIASGSITINAPLFVFYIRKLEVHCATICRNATLLTAAVCEAATHTQSSTVRYDPQHRPHNTHCSASASSDLRLVARRTTKGSSPFFDRLGRAGGGTRAPPRCGEGRGQGGFLVEQGGGGVRTGGGLPGVLGTHRTTSTWSKAHWSLPAPAWRACHQRSITPFTLASLGRDTAQSRKVSNQHDER